MVVLRKLLNPVLLPNQAFAYREAVIKNNAPKITDIPLQQYEKQCIDIKAEYADKGILKLFLHRPFVSAVYPTTSNTQFPDTCPACTCGLFSVRHPFSRLLFTLFDLRPLLLNLRI